MLLEGLNAGAQGGGSGRGGEEGLVGQPDTIALLGLHLKESSDQILREKWERGGGGGGGVKGREGTEGCVGCEWRRGS